MTRSVWLEAYFARNVGDDLMVTEVVGSRPDLEFVTRRLQRSGAAMAELTNLREAGGASRGLAQYLAAAGYVIVGGSMFQDYRGDPTNRGRDLVRYVRQLAMASYMRLRARPVLIVGCNVGPFQTRVGEFFRVLLFRLATGVSVRDSQSSRWLREIGVDHVLAADMVFAQKHQLGTSRDDSGGSRLVLGLSVLLPRDYSFNVAFGVFDRVLDAVMGRYPGSHAKIFAFQAIMADDEALARELAVQRSDAEVLVYDGRPETFLREMRDVDYFVCTRLHSFILAVSLGVPCSVLSYSSKVSNILDDLGWPKSVFHLEDLSSRDLDDLCREIDERRVFAPDVTSAQLHSAMLRESL